MTCLFRESTKNFVVLLISLSTSIGGVSIQLSLARRAMSAGLNNRFSSSSSSSSAEKNQDICPWLLLGSRYTWTKTPGYGTRTAQNANDGRVNRKFQSTV